MAHPIVLNESRLLAVNDHVHAEPSLVESALGLEFIQSCERGYSENRHGKYVEKGSYRDGGLHTKCREQSRTEWLSHDLVSVASRVCTLDIGVVLVDREIVWRNPAQPDVSFEVG